MAFVRLLEATFYADISIVAICIFCITLRVGALSSLNGDHETADQTLPKIGEEEIIPRGQHDTNHESSNSQCKDARTDRFTC